MTWRAVVAEASVPAGAPLAVEVDGCPLVVWRPADGEPVVMDARCPHQWSHLGHEGVVDGDELVCTAHHWRFDACGTGTKVNVNGRRDPKADVVVHASRVRAGVVECDLDAAPVGGPHRTGEPSMTDASTAPTEPDRLVLAREIAAGDARAIVVRVGLPSPPAQVWAACTEPAQLERWIGPVSGDLRVSGRFSLPGVTGEIVQCDPDRVLTVTWVSGDGPVDELQVRLTPVGDGTMIELEHASVPGAGDDDVLVQLGAEWEARVVIGLIGALGGAGAAPDVAAYADAQRAAWADVVRGPS